MDQLIVLTAPPATGKTHLVSSLIQATNQIPLVLAPLRALVDECRSRWEGKAEVMTPEEWLMRGRHHEFVIIDEFHLYLYWGDSFRSAMWEAFYGALANAKVVLLLTATLNLEAKEFIQGLGGLFEIHWVDYGNQTLRFVPQRYVKYPNREWLFDWIRSQGLETQGNLIFCRYRQEVVEWVDYLTQLGFSVWGCVGGEAKSFSDRLRTESPPQFIVATTVLSHGVNLPSIRCVYFTYAIRNLDFWIQMVARGGRRGEKFSVYALENPRGLKWNSWTNFLAIQWRNLRMRWHLGAKEIQTWFLKGSS